MYVRIYWILLLYLLHPSHNKADFEENFTFTLRSFHLINHLMNLVISCIFLKSVMHCHEYYNGLLEGNSILPPQPLIALAK